MKKTIIALMALAGVAVAEDWTATFTTSNQSKDQTYTDYTATFEVGSPLTLTFKDLAYGSTGTYNGEYSATAAGSVQPTAIRPNANICSDGSYTLKFELENTSNSTLTIEAITLNVFGYNKSGNAHTVSGSQANLALKYTLPNSSENITLTSSANVYSTASVAYSMTEAQYIDLAAGSKITMELSVTKKAGSGGFVGLSNATFKVVPEPTTATLSLLALAGLAARRRRR